MKNLIGKRFTELDAQLRAVEATKHYESSDYIPGDRVDEDLLLNWLVKARNLFSKACGKDSEHYRQLDEAATPQSYETSYSRFRRIKAVYLAAKEDFEGGVLSIFAWSRSSRSIRFGVGTGRRTA